MLKIENLRVEIKGKEILKGISFEVNDGEIFVIFGPKGSGKTTLMEVLRGETDDKVIKGKIVGKKDLLLLDEPKMPAKELRALLKDNTKPVIITTRNDDILEAVKTKSACVMIKGEIICEKTPQKIAKAINANRYRGCVQCKFYDRKCKV